MSQCPFGVTKKQLLYSAVRKPRCGLCSTLHHFGGLRSGHPGYECCHWEVNGAYIKQSMTNCNRWCHINDDDDDDDEEQFFVVVVISLCSTIINPFKGGRSVEPQKLIKWGVVSTEKYTNPGWQVQKRVGLCVFYPQMVKTLCYPSIFTNQTSKKGHLCSRMHVASGKWYKPAIIEGYIARLFFTAVFLVWKDVMPFIFTVAV